MIEEALIKLGWGEREAKVYVSLLRVGRATATQLIKRLGRHRQLVYTALERLEKDGLVTAEQRGTKREFRAAPPKRVIERQLQQMALAHEVLPKLEQLQSKVLSEQVVQLHLGFEGVKFVREDMLASLTSGDKILALGASGPNYARVMGDYHFDWTNRRLQKKIKLEALGFEKEKESISQLLHDRAFTQMRYLPANYQAPTSTVIYDNKVVIQIWGPAEPVMILIENAKVAQSYRHYFQFLWKQAKK